MNEYDSNRISDLFKANGYLESYDSQNVNCYILNTCHIREKATEKVYSATVSYTHLTLPTICSV